MIKRFDRVAGETLHLHSVTGLTHTNFNIPMHYSYDDLFRLTRYLTGSQEAVNEQFKRMVFNIVGRNQDDHAKNFAFVMDKHGNWEVSPAYDITYANGAGYTKNHQFSLGGKTNGFVKKDILEIAKKHSIKQSFAESCLDQIQEAFSHFKKRALALDINKDFVALIEKDLRVTI